MSGMTPEQQKELQAAQEAYAKATPEQRKAIQAAAMAQMTPEQRAQVEAGVDTSSSHECHSPCQSRAAHRLPAHRTRVRRRAACLGFLLESVLTCGLLTQAEATQRGMQDMSAFCERIKPDPADPDKKLSTFDMITALASCPSFALIGEQCNAATIDAIEAALLENAARPHPHPDPHPHPHPNPNPCPHRRPHPRAIPSPSPSPSP